MADRPGMKMSPEAAALAAAAYAAAQAAPGPEVEHSNPDMGKFSDALRTDPELHAKLFLSSHGQDFAETAVNLAAERGLKITTAEVNWHLSESRRLGGNWVPLTRERPDGWYCIDDPDGAQKCADSDPDVDR